MLIQDVMLARVPSPERPARLPVLVGALIAVLAAILGFTTASASAAGAAETRVRASAAVVEVPVGATERIAAGQRLGNDVAEPDFVVATGGAAKSGDELLDAARVARDAKAAEVGRSKATVTGGYGRDGVPRARCSSSPIGGAEDDVARQIGGNPKDITFTEAIRPRTGDQVPICQRCQATFDQSQFPPGTLFDPAGPWGAR
ncbi:hypothetical protein SAMN05421595_0697 [Austwickia chelonae]|uniref:Uncharacterized protein n=1 Tax=Austwickia chelonae NBRC 105200 TaxID=1184607 RepID=K6VS61_9MICO|nr:hypothetical protein AUCHE_08_04200 [Austwickia chelonae NBRC 105200]SEV98227.1 hypothetical protein SAMN05421595_0697 [Austwickia chelonae]